MSKNTIFYVQSTKNTVPAKSALTGTYETQGTVLIGDGTAFLTEVSYGDWVYSPTKNEVQVVVNITSDTRITLREAFTTDVVAGEAFSVVKQINLPVSIKIDNYGAGNAVVDGVNLPTTKAVEWYVSVEGQRRITDCMNPVVLDATASNCGITILKY